MTVSRRSLLAGSAATAFALSFKNTLAADSSFIPFKLLPGQKVLCFVGGYTSGGTGGVEGSGPGITTFEMDPQTGILTFVQAFTDIVSPSYIIFNKDHKFLYALSEIDDYNGTTSGSVTSFSVDPVTGDLRKLNTVSSGGASPCYLSLHPSGDYIFVANYMGGTIAALPINKDGTLGEASDIIHNTGPKMPSRAADNPVGNFAISNHDGSHPHMIKAGKKGVWIFVDDAGLDRVYLWHFDTKKGRFYPGDIPFYSLPPGSAPRHFVLNKDETIIYNLCEQDSKIIVSNFHIDTGHITPIQTISTVVPEFKGSTLAAEILLSENGKHIYVSNRLGDSIAIFDIQPNGTLVLQTEVWAHADYGRAMNFDPTHNFLFVANQRSDSITCFRVNRGTGGLTFTKQYTAVGSPTTLGFMLTEPES